MVGDCAYLEVICVLIINMISVLVTDVISVNVAV